jgi:hypothetical protein
MNLKLSSNSCNGRALLPSTKESSTGQEQHQSMFICFIYIDKIVHKEFIPPSQTVNKEFYCGENQVEG